MKKLLWIGDAECDTGFERCTRYSLEALREKYEVHVLGLNYRGDPHTRPYPIYPAWGGGDLFGIGRVIELLQKIRPQVVVIQNDPWNIPAYVEQVDMAKDVPRPVLVGAIAIDGKNMRGYALNGLDHCVFWTKFAQYEAIRGGYTKTSGIVPLGVDLDIYNPLPEGEDRVKLRMEGLGLTEQISKGFFVGNINRNQPRKRLDLTIRYFAEWIQQHNILDAYLLLHVAPTGDYGFDLEQLAGYYGLQGRILISKPQVFKGLSEEKLVKLYRCFDVQINTGVGEGWGLTTMEGMACGIPQIVGDWSALGEWAKTSARVIPCEPQCSVNPGMVQLNVIGGIMKAQETITTLHELYSEPQKRAYYRAQGLRLTQQERFRWPNIAAEFTREVDTAVTSVDG